MVLKSFRRRHQSLRYRQALAKVRFLLRKGVLPIYAQVKLHHWYRRLQRYGRQLAWHVLSFATLSGMAVQESMAQLPEGSEFRVNDFNAGNQFNAQSDRDKFGNTVVVYQSENLDGDGFGIFVKLYDANGNVTLGETKVNTYTTSNQSGPAVAMDAVGNFTVVWSSSGQDGSYGGIYGQRYNAAGNMQGSEFRINSYTTNSQQSPSITMDADGDFVVVWDSNDQDGSSGGIYGQRYNAAGITQGSEFRVNTYTTGNQRTASVAMDGEGNFTVAWRSTGQDGSSFGIYGQRYNVFGVAQGSEFRVNTYTTSHQLAPSIAMDEDGDFTVVWQSNGQDGSFYGIYGQRYNAAGSPQGNEFRVNTYTTLNQLNPAIAMDPDGDFIVVWSSYNQDGSSYGIYGQRYNPGGTSNGNEFQVNSYTTLNQTNPFVTMDAEGAFIVLWQSNGQNGTVNSVFGQRYILGTGSEFQINTYTTSHQRNPSMVMDDNGDFIVVWQSSGQDGSGEGIYGQRYSATGNPQGIEFRVNTYTTGSQFDPTIAMNDHGIFVVLWVSSDQDGSGWGIFGQRYNAVGMPLGGEFRVNSFTTGDQKRPAVAMDGDGDFTVLWVSSDQDGSQDGIYGQRYNAEGVALGSEFLVNTFTIFNQRHPSIAMDAEGDFTVIWASYSQDGSPASIYGQRYNASGMTQGNEFRVNTYTADSQLSPSIAMDGNGNFVVVWESEDQDGSFDGIYGQRYNAIGVPQGSEFQVSSYTTLSQRGANIEMDVSGDFVVVWASRDQDGAGYGIYGQRYNASGVAQGGEFRVNTVTSGPQNGPAMAIDADGDFAVIWQSHDQDAFTYGIYGQRFTGKFVPCSSSPFTLSGSQSSDIIFRTQSTLTSSQNIMTGIDVGYKAANSINLESGFQVASGSVLLAVIEGCEN